MKKVFALILAAMLLLSCAACGGQEPAPTSPTTEPTTPTTESTEPTTESQGHGDTTYIQLSISEEDGSYAYLTAYDDGAGGAYVEFMGDVRKIAMLSTDVLNDIEEQIQQSPLKDLFGQEVYEDGLASASMYVAYSDGSSLTAGFAGVIPQAFRDGYTVVEDYFRVLLTDEPVYTPTPSIEGEPDPEALQAMEDLLVASGVQPLDMYLIADVLMDENFTAMMGLSKTDGIVNGLSCSPLMSAVAFSCMIAKAENEDAVAAIADDFAENIQWNRWVCVSATDAVIATKGNLVMCLVSTGDLFTQIADTAQATDWTVVKSLTN